MRGLFDARRQFDRDLFAGRNHPNHEAHHQILCVFHKNCVPRYESAHFDSIPKVDKEHPSGSPKGVPSESRLKDSSTAIILSVRNWRPPRCESGESADHERRVSR